MDNKKDITIKQDGQHISVTFNTEKAKKAFYNANKEVPVKKKLTILSESISTLVAWAITHGLTIDSQVKIKINLKV